MPTELHHLTLSGRRITFHNPDGMYPVNQYQSLVLASAAEHAALSIAARRGCSIADLSAWEVCCGGGPAAVTLKADGLGFVQASDLQSDSLEHCRANADLNGLVLDRTVQGSLLDDGEDRRFDIIACNPPCGVLPLSADRRNAAMNVAVTGGDGGMDLTRGLLEGCARRLTEHGSLLIAVVSTGDVRALVADLDARFAGLWRAFPAQPVAMPFIRASDPRAPGLTDGSLGHEALVWERPDGSLWRLTWIIEVSPGGPFRPFEGGVADPPGLPLCPAGLSVARDPALKAMVDRHSDNGIWLSRTSP